MLKGITILLGATLFGLWFVGLRSAHSVVWQMGWTFVFVCAFLVLRTAMTERRKSFSSQALSEFEREKIRRQA